MAITLGDVNACLQHERTERYPRNPADEADDSKNGEEQENDAT